MPRLPWLMAIVRATNISHIRFYLCELCNICWWQAKGCCCRARYAAHKPHMRQPFMSKFIIRCCAHWQTHTHTRPQNTLNFAQKSKWSKFVYIFILDRVFLHWAKLVSSSGWLFHRSEPLKCWCFFFIQSGMSAHIAVPMINCVVLFSLSHERQPTLAAWSVAHTHTDVTRLFIRYTRTSHSRHAHERVPHTQSRAHTNIRNDPCRESYNQHMHNIYRTRSSTHIHTHISESRHSCIVYTYISRNNMHSRGATEITL